LRAGATDHRDDFLLLDQLGDVLHSALRIRFIGPHEFCRTAQHLAGRLVERQLHAGGEVTPLQRERTLLGQHHADLQRLLRRGAANVEGGQRGRCGHRSRFPQEVPARGGGILGVFRFRTHD